MAHNIHTYTHHKLCAVDLLYGHIILLLLQPEVGRREWGTPQRPLSRRRSRTYDTIVVALSVVKRV